MMSLLGRLFESPGLFCTECGGRLVQDEGAAACEGCLRRYPVRNGALDLFDRYSARIDLNVPDEYVLKIAAHLDLANGAEQIQAVRAAIEDTLLVAQHRTATAEIAELGGRLGIESPPGFEIRVSGPTAQDPDACKVVFERHYFDGELPRSSRLRRSIRIKNIGQLAVSANNDFPLYLSYHWLYAKGAVYVWDGLRTTLPAAIAPDQSMTVIADVKTPEQTGNYILRVQLVLEDRCWLDAPVMDIPIVVSNRSARSLPVARTSNSFDYATDHQRSVDHLVRIAETRFAGKSGRGLAVEVASGIHPHARSLTKWHDLIATDISLPQCELGALYFSHAGRRDDALAFIVCDATTLPLPQRSVDVIAIFAAVHHFEEPERVLKSLARFLAPGGFIGVMCEPSNAAPEDPSYLRDIAKGINEQMWTEPEWVGIIEKSGLRIFDGQIEGSSMRLFLEPAHGSSQPWCH